MSWRYGRQNPKEGVHKVQKGLRRTTAHRAVLLAAIISICSALAKFLRRSDNPY
jgi:hypothetical protein